jgi:hypothetical protein
MSKWLRLGPERFTQVLVFDIVNCQYWGRYGGHALHLQRRLRRRIIRCDNTNDSVNDNDDNNGHDYTSTELCMDYNAEQQQPRWKCSITSDVT